MLQAEGEELRRRQYLVHGVDCLGHPVISFSLGALMFAPSSHCRMGAIRSGGP